MAQTATDYSAVEIAYFKAVVSVAFIFVSTENQS